MKKLQISILYDAAEDEEKARAEAQGGSLVLTRETVGQALAELGHEVRFLAAPAKPKSLITMLDRDDSDLIVNLCEALDGVSQREQHVAALLELLDKRFTGAGALGLALAQDKELSKKTLTFHGLRCPRYSVVDSGRTDWADDLEFPLFVKPLDQDASIGIDDRSIARTVRELLERVSYVQTTLGSPALIEEYVEGREIYVGVLGNGEPKALPLIELDFSRLPKDRPRIASSAAKWDETSEEYRLTKDVFPKDIPVEVRERMRQAAVTAFKALRLRDYGRVDMRLRRKAGAKPDAPLCVDAALPAAPEPPPPPPSPLDQTGPDDWEFFVIEVNPNPDLGKASELALAAKKDGLRYPALLERILGSALARYGMRA